MRILLLICIACLATGASAADVYVASNEKFRAADDTSGPGFYWVDSTTGRTWLMDIARNRWVYCGTPDGASPSPVGTFIPRSSKSSPGVYVLNTATGEGWFFNGRGGWKSHGVPLDKEPE